jgi:Cys-rich protein (TIGR01571 family)
MYLSAFLALMAWLCPCVALAQITSRLGIYGGYTHVLVGVGFLIVLENITQGNWEITDYPVRKGGSDIVALLSALALVVFVAAVRTRIRTIHRIQGSETEDFVCAFFCMSCTIAQMATEVGAYAPGRCNFGPRETLPAYTSV